jgi:predicted transcriptional regulator of viral defense system
MRWIQLQEIIREQSIFETAVLLAGDDVSPYQVQKQLSDWTKAGKVIQLRRGVYTLPDQNPHPFVVANHLIPGSYVSLQMALGYYHLIPEHVAVITSVTTGRSAQFKNRIGRFSFRHIHPNLFFGITYRLLVDDEYAYVAAPEKALLDLVHFTTRGDSAAFLDSLRLQHLDILDIDQLHRFAERSGKPKLKRAAAHIAAIARRQTETYETL